MSTAICPKCNKEFNKTIYLGKKRIERKKHNSKCFECCPYSPQQYKTRTNTCHTCKKEFFPVTYHNGKRLWRRSRGFCFECVPYTPGRHKNSKTHNKNTSDGLRPCRICKEYKTLDNFGMANKLGNLNSYCRSCHAKRNRKPKHRFKEECIAYKGGKCIKCGYSKSPAALEFHHRDPDQKDFSISQSTKVTLRDNIKLELDKCDLVCSNCHREIHYYLEEDIEKWY